MGQAPSAALPPVSHSQPRHRCCSICRVGCSAHTYTPQTHTLQGTVGRTSASQGEASPTNTGVRQRGGQAPRATAVYTYTTKHQAGVGSWATATSPPAFSTHNSAPLDGPQARAHAPHRLCWTGGIGPGSAPLRHLQTHGFTGDMQQAGAGISAMLGPCPHTHTHHHHVISPETPFRHTESGGHTSNRR